MFWSTDYYWRSLCSGTGTWGYNWYRFTETGQLIIGKMLMIDWWLMIASDSNSWLSAVEPDVQYLSDIFEVDGCQKLFRSPWSLRMALSYMSVDHRLPVSLNQLETFICHEQSCYGQCHCYRDHVALCFEDWSKFLIFVCMILSIMYAIIQLSSQPIMWQCKYAATKLINVTLIEMTTNIPFRFSEQESISCFSCWSSKWWKWCIWVYTAACRSDHLWNSHLGSTCGLVSWRLSKLS